MASQTLTGTSAVAKVNLLPPEIAEKAKVRRAKAAMVGTGLAAVGVVGLMYVTQSAKVSSAKTDLAAAQARTTTLNADVGKLRNVSEVYARRQAMEQVLVTAMGKEVRWSRFLNDLSLTVPADVWVTEFSGKQVLDGASPSGAAAAASTPGGGAPVLVDPGIGTVTVKGVGIEWFDVAAWLDTLAKQAGYVNAFMTSAERIERKPENPIKFDSTTNLNAKALSGRYTKRVGG